MEPPATSTVHRNLDGKPKILGMEIQDVVLLGLLASALNLIFGGTDFGAAATFGPPLILGPVLALCKRGKPEGYVADLVRFHTTPGFYGAGEEGPKEQRRKIYHDP